MTTPSAPVRRPMRSYAQNFEDVRLERVFRDQAGGFYVDVGAASPRDDSVTRHFYDRGWRGIDIEPNEDFLRMLREERPRDVCLGVVCSDHEGIAQLHESEAADGRSTLSDEVAHTVTDRYGPMHVRTVETTTLAAIFEKHVVGPVDFLKIDVEGHEREVLLGADFTRWRPRILVIEAMAPHLPIPSHQIWESLVLEAGYVLATFDGLNRFYVDAVEAEAMGPLLATPISTFDEYELDRYLRAIERLIEEKGEFHRMAENQRAHNDQLENALTSADAEIRRRDEQIDEQHQRLDAARADAAHWREMYEERLAASIRVPASVAGGLRQAARRVRRTKP